MGGTEIYVEGLVRQQRLSGMESIVAAPATLEATYLHHDIRVRRFPVTEVVEDIREMYAEGDILAAEGFGKILESERPDLVHLHAFTRGTSLRLVRETKRRGLPVVFSYHTPTVSCQRGTLLRWGTEACDGIVEARLCSACVLHGLGLNQHLCGVAASLPSGVGRILRSAGLSGGVWTALRMSELVALRHAAFRSLMTEVDHVVALCQWVKDLLLRNGVPAEKITVSRQGVWQSNGHAARPSGPTRTTGPRLRILFLGRIDPTKGAHVLIEALRAAPQIPVELDIYGVVQSEAAVAYLARLKQIAGGDRRVTFRNAIPGEQVVGLMRNYDMLAVPSQWFETGPMVVMEAFAAGLPVIGSNLGGIAELVTHGVNGLLLEPRSAHKWCQALEALCRDPELVATLRNGIRRPRSIADVATDMSKLYAGLLEKTDRLQFAGRTTFA